MCVALAAAPVLTQIATVAAIGSTAMSFIGQSQAASAQSKYQNSRYAAAQKSADEQYRLDISQTHERAAQETAVSSQQSLNNTRQAESGIGTARAGAASGNVGGQVLADIEQQFRMIESENEFNIRENRKNTLNQLELGLRGAHANAKNRINAALPQPVQRPSLLGLGFDLVGAGLNGYLLGQQIKPPGGSSGSSGSSGGG